MEPFSLTIGNTSLTGTNTAGFWEVDEFEGWWGAPESKGHTITRPNADGDMLTPLNYGPRYITIIGAFAASTPEHVAHGMGELSALLSAGPDWMTVTLHGETTTARVERAGPIEPRLAAYRLVQYEFQVKAPDPRRYGDTRQTALAVGGTADLFHRGNYEAWPVVEVTGDFPSGYTLTGPGGREFVVTENPGAATHTIDMRTGLLLIGSNYWTGHTGDSDVFSVGRGQIETIGLTASGASGSAAVSITDTYI